MAIRSLNRLRKIRNAIIALRLSWLNRTQGTRIHPTASLSLSSRFVNGRKDGIIVGERTLVAFKTLLCTNDPSFGRNGNIVIGRHCFIGGGSVIAPGVTIGDESIVGAGSVVMDDVPSRCIVGGNPARILRRDIEVGPYGRLKGADANTRAMWR